MRGTHGSVVLRLPSTLTCGAVVRAGSGHLVVLREVDLDTQLDTFFKRSLHKLALDVARALKVGLGRLGARCSGGGV